MKALHLVAAVCLAALLYFSMATASPNMLNAPRTLIYYTTPSFKTDYSLFLSSLQSKGHTLTLINPIDDAYPLKSFDKLLYDNVFVFCGHASSKVPGFPKPLDFSQFIEAGGSLWVAPVDGVISEDFRSLALQYGVEYLPATSQLINTNDPANRVLSLSLPNHDNYILNTKQHDGKTGKVSVTGLGMYTVDNISYIKKALVGTKTTIAVDTKSGLIYDTGENISLLTAVQLKKNQRIVFMSEVSIISNIFAQQDDNYSAFIDGAVCWVTHDCGYIRIKTLQHYAFAPNELVKAVNPYINTKRVHQTTEEEKVPELNVVSKNNHFYKTGEHVHFDIVLEQYNPQTKQWDEAISNDLIFDATCLHSKIKFPIEPKSTMVLAAKENSIYANTKQNENNIPVEVTMPDFMGVFKISVSSSQAFSHAQSSGITNLSPSTEKQMVINVRPLLHNEYPRFLFVAYPYYFTMVLTMIASLVFAVAFLYTK